MRKQRHRKLGQLVQSLVTGKLGSEPSLAWHLCFYQWYYRSTLSRILGAKQETATTKTNQTNPKNNPSCGTLYIVWLNMFVPGKISKYKKPPANDWLSEICNTSINVRKVLCSHLNYLPHSGRQEQEAEDEIREREWGAKSRRVTV